MNKQYELGDLCHFGDHILSEDNVVRFPGSKKITCKACERWYATHRPQNFWMFKERNLRRFADSDELWQARCNRYMELIGLPELARIA